MDAIDGARPENDPITATEIVTMASAVALIVVLLLFVVAAI